MSLIPAFEIGLFNAWILILYIIGYNIVPFYLSTKRMIDQETVKKVDHPDIEESKSQKHLGIILMVVFYIPIVYSIFLPIIVNTTWFIFGMIIYFSGIFIGTSAMYYFFKTPSEKLVTDGIYRYSRNPMYLSIILLYTGIAIVCLSWFFLFFTIIFTILTYFLILSEEDYCIKKYKNKFNDYMSKTPRWIGFQKPNS
jgi:protein-S-isoprenylcysteine O-methyltransferase Ste14